MIFKIGTQEQLLNYICIAIVNSCTEGLWRHGIGKVKDNDGSADDAMISISNSVISR